MIGDHQARISSSHPDACGAGIATPAFGVMAKLIRQAGGSGFIPQTTAA
jgi:hypothetical protein